MAPKGKCTRNRLAAVAAESAKAAAAEGRGRATANTPPVSARRYGRCRRRGGGRRRCANHSPVYRPGHCRPLAATLKGWAVARGQPAAARRGGSEFASMAGATNNGYEVDGRRRIAARQYLGAAE